MNVTNGDAEVIARAYSETGDLIGTGLVGLSAKRGMDINLTRLFIGSPIPADRIGTISFEATPQGGAVTDILRIRTGKRGEIDLAKTVPAQ
jgi:hypothetical protein